MHPESAPPDDPWSPASRMQSFRDLLLAVASFGIGLAAYVGTRAPKR